MAKGKRYRKRTPKGNIYYQFSKGMRELMSEEPIVGMVDDATYKLYNMLSMTGYGKYEVRCMVAGYPVTTEPISWHGYVLTDWHGVNANKKYDIVQKMLNTIGG